MLIDLNGMRTNCYYLKSVPATGEIFCQHGQTDRKENMYKKKIMYYIYTNIYTCIKEIEQGSGGHFGSYPGSLWAAISVELAPNGQQGNE